MVCKEFAQQRVETTKQTFSNLIIQHLAKLGFISHSEPSYIEEYNEFEGTHEDH